MFIINLRWYWENNHCNKLVTHYWRKHSQALCNDCVIDLHKKCKWNEIPDFKSVTESLYAAKFLLTSIQETSEYFKTNYRISFKKEFKMYSEILAKIDEKVRYWCITSINNLAFSINKWSKTIRIMLDYRGNTPVSTHLNLIITLTLCGKLILAYHVQINLTFLSLKFKLLIRKTQ